MFHDSVNSAKHCEKISRLLLFSLFNGILELFVEKDLGNNL